MTYEATIELVLDHLRETRGDWEVLPNEAMRRDVECETTCPVASAAGYVGIDLSDARRDGFHEQACADLTLAADTTAMYDRGVGNLRTRMFEAAGLEAVNA